ncbi:hypothetical protein [Nitrospira sp. Nam74]
MPLTHSAKHATLFLPGLLILLASFTTLVNTGCAGKTTQQVRTVAEEGLNVVRLEQSQDSQPNTHPVALSPSEVATILRGVRVWERRNVIHRLISGVAPKTRAFRDDDLSFLAPAISRAVAQASPSEQVYFHLSHVTPTGEEETTTGWLFVRDPILHLMLSEVHDRHGPGPDISRYDRQMPDIPETSGLFNATFEPEEYLVKVRSGGSWFSADQREELLIRYRDALPSLPVHPLSEKAVPSQPSQ